MLDNLAIFDQHDQQGFSPMRVRSNQVRLMALLFISAGASIATAADDTLPWTGSHEFEEASFTKTLDSKVRIHVNAPLDSNGKPARATRLIVYTLPAGNTIEQTLGCQMKPGLDWHYDIQHVAAQVRLLRALDADEEASRRDVNASLGETRLRERIVLLCVEGPGLSWTRFRKEHPDADAQMAQLVEQWRKEFAADGSRVLLTGHSNGGSFMFGVIDGADEIPAYIDRIAFLDANYNFDAPKHVQKITRWLKDDEARRLIVVAYDDREITLAGKKVVGPNGGTFRATGRMREALGKEFDLREAAGQIFHETVGLDGRIHFYVHPNSQNKILHTALVGDMNGLVHVDTLGSHHEEKWGKFGGPRAYSKYIQREPTIDPQNKSVRTSSIRTKSSGPSETVVATRGAATDDLPIVTQTQLPPRPEKALSGSEFIKNVRGLSLAEREAAMLREIIGGNFPEFLRWFKAVKIQGMISDNGSQREVEATIEVMPDYLGIGGRDWVRMPMRPQTAQQIADQFGCILPTRKIVDAIDAQSEIHLGPRPMTEAREAVATFLEHHQIIESQRGSRPAGPLTIGIKKDIVLTPRIFEKPERLAIYDWRQLDGTPIQPLTIVHWDKYVDYSHGARLVRDRLVLDGNEVKISELLADPARCGLVSDEGAMNPPRYPAE
jgi:hypothetical protein